MRRAAATLIGGAFAVAACTSLVGVQDIEYSDSDSKGSGDPSPSASGTQSSVPVSPPNGPPGVNPPSSVTPPGPSPPPLPPPPPGCVKQPIGGSCGSFTECCSARCSAALKCTNACKIGSATATCGGNEDCCVGYVCLNGICQK